MQYNEILALLDRGLTPDQIMNLQNAPAPAEEPQEATPQEADPVPQPEKAPEWAVTLNQNIQRMTNALHASAIMNAQQPEVKPQTAEEALAAIIAPAPKTKK